MPIHAAFSRAATRLTEWTQRWVPGTFTIAWLLTLIVLVLGMTVGRASFIRCIEAWGDGFWELLPFSMQMALIMFTGAIVAVSPPVRRALAWLASRPRTPRQSVLLVALSSMLLALLHWGISVVGSAVLVREMGRRRSGADYRLLVAAAYLGVAESARDIAVRQVQKKRDDPIVQQLVGEMDTELANARMAWEQLVAGGAADREPSLANSDEIYKHPKMPYTQRLLAAIPKGWHHS